ncbi:MAG: hypothetical protein PHI45_02010 [Candidatus Pacebacteria bacterium]|nr:hypothetical protein [Candidatus Paceibacterota bacterium]MDD5752834.1 hypothetical protein [Candidatus Paceibacterota bacterium]
MKKQELYFATMYPLEKGGRPLWQMHTVYGPYDNIYQIEDTLSKRSTRGRIKHIIVFEGKMFSVGEKGQLKKLSLQKTLIEEQ